MTDRTPHLGRRESGEDPRQLYLGRMTGPMAVELLDGEHSDPAGVTLAAKLHTRIFGDEGPWCMVEISDVPEKEGDRADA